VKFNEDLPCIVFMKSAAFHVPTTTYNGKYLRIPLLRLVFLTGLVV
jgi:hypothetical protein